MRGPGAVGQTVAAEVSLDARLVIVALMTLTGSFVLAALLAQSVIHL